jgi:ubiquinone/menaquinone biosynthesis C-methylase UbiE
MNHNFTKKIGETWSQAAYYETHEQDHFMDFFWKEGCVFKRMFDTLTPDNILELACGHGRHVPRYQHLAKKITLVDINQSNIDFCRNRFAGNDKILCIVNNGTDLQDVPSESVTAVFSYDAMVHFEMTDVMQYIQEFSRILRSGGRALIHHSNNSGNPGGNPMWHPHWRNFMSLDIVTYAASRANFTIIEQQTLRWGEINNVDGVTLMQKI